MLRQRHVPIGNGRSLWVARYGQGSPAIVMSSGFGVSLDVWRRLQLSLGERHLTLSYDRAGFGHSPPGPMPRTTSATVRDLRQALLAIGLDGPIILVGYSSGGFDACYYTYAYPEQVAGLVLVDPTIPMLERKLARIRGEPRIKRPPAGDPTSAAASEERSLEWESSDEIRDVHHRGLGDVPLIVITSEHIADSLGPDASQHQREAVTKLWYSEHRRYAALSSKGVQTIAYGSGHDVLRQAPEKIEEAIATVCPG